MQTGWVDSIPDIIEGGRERITRNPQGSDFGPVDLNSPPKGCGHTTEGSGDPPAYGNSAPHFTIGKTKICQHRPLGRMAGTLRNNSGGVETNSLIRVQFELVGFSQLEPWLPPDRQFQLLASLYEFCQQECGIPENHVWPDVLESGVIWASESNPRRGRKFPSEPGWYNHVEIPENSHWDCGSMLISKIMNRERISMVDAFQLVIAYTTSNGSHRESVAVSPKFRKRADLRKWIAKEGKLRGTLWRALNGEIRKDGRTIKVKRARPHVAERRVPEDQLS